MGTSVGFAKISASVQEADKAFEGFSYVPPGEDAFDQSWSCSGQRWSVLNHWSLLIVVFHANLPSVSEQDLDWALIRSRCCFNLYNHGNCVTCYFSREELEYNIYEHSTLIGFRFSVRWFCTRVFFNINDQGVIIVNHEISGWNLIIFCSLLSVCVLCTTTRYM